jgi:hypothetical protein
LARRARPRPRITQELTDWIGRLAKGNPAWGAPKIHAELQKLGFSVAEQPWPDICLVWFGAVIPVRSGSPFSRITAR